MNYDDWKCTPPAYETPPCLHCGQPMLEDDDIIGDMHHDCVLDANYGEHQAACAACAGGDCEECEWFVGPLQSAPMNTRLLKRSMRLWASDKKARRGLSRYASVELGTDRDGYQVTLRIYPHMEPRYHVDRSISSDNPRTILQDLFNG